MSPMFERGYRKGFAEYQRDVARGHVLREDMQIVQRAADILNGENFQGPETEASQYALGFLEGYSPVIPRMR